MNYSLSPHISEMLLRHADKPSRELETAVIMAGEGLQQGHVCLDIRELAASTWTSEEGRQLSAPSLGHWREKLIDSGVVGGPGEYLPLILDSHLLYFHRYYTFEVEVADFIRARQGRYTDNLDLEKLKSGLSRLFPEIEGDETDWQKVAAFLALTGRFTVISGGPGTGKTTTVARILALFLEQDPSSRISLAAPTGKAAARLQDALLGARNSLQMDPGVLQYFPEKTSTIHRLLGKTRVRRRKDPEKRLTADVLVIDEASMIDLPLMAELLAAVPAHCSLILLGDRYQLASVQPGAVFADICQGNTYSFTRECSNLAWNCRAGNLPDDSNDIRSDCLVELQTNYRFSDKSGIGLLSSLVKAGRAEEAHALLAGHGQPELAWHDFDLHPPEQTVRKIASRSREILRHLSTSRNPEEALNIMQRMIVLCALRRGPFGSVNINGLTEEATESDSRQIFYHGRPLLITQNDYRRELYNGDTGVVCSSGKREDELRCFFPSRPEGLSPYQLPEFETAYALTVHKSQGSEYDHVVLVLSDSVSPVLTRELLYTGITRARHSVEIWASTGVFKESVSKGSVRRSGLAHRLNQSQ